MEPHPNRTNTRSQLNSRAGNQPLTPNPRQSASGAPGADRAAQHVDGQLRGENQPAAARQPQHSGAFTVIPPNQSRRSKNKAMAQKEEEEYLRYKEAHKPAPLHLNPERLGGGDVTLAEARQRQCSDLRCSKLQKKLKKEEMDKKKRQEEEEELQRMKVKQREKSERLEVKRQQEEERRREQFQQDRIRVNQAFLDKLECRNRGMGTETSNCFSQEEERPRLAPDDYRRQAAAGRVSLTHPGPDPEQSRSNWTEETDQEPDYGWNLMKLMNSFPDCNKEFLQDILTQCSGDYQQAYTLLISTLS
ncbi:uncharacterized protein epsti1 [Anableps anableps]